MKDRVVKIHNIPGTNVVILSVADCSYTAVRNSLIIENNIRELQKTKNAL